MYVGAQDRQPKESNRLGRNTCPDERRRGIFAQCCNLTWLRGPERVESRTRSAYLDSVRIEYRFLTPVLSTDSEDVWSRPVSYIDVRSNLIGRARIRTQASQIGASVTNHKLVNWKRVMTTRSFHRDRSQLHPNDRLVVIPPPLVITIESRRHHLQPLRENLSSYS